MAKKLFTALEFLFVAIALTAFYITWAAHLGLFGFGWYTSGLLITAGYARSVFNTFEKDEADDDMNPTGKAMLGLMVGPKKKGFPAWSAILAILWIAITMYLIFFPS